MYTSVTKPRVVRVGRGDAGPSRGVATVEDIELMRRLSVGVSEIVACGRVTAVVRALVRAGVTGLRYQGSRCPLAVCLTGKVGRPVRVGQTITMSLQEPGLIILMDTPELMLKVAEAFDNGHFPELVDKGVDPWA